MTRVKFSIDGRGPFDGAMRFGKLGDGEIEFIAIPARVSGFGSPKTVTVHPDDGAEFSAPIVRITTDGGYRAEADDTMTGYIVFETT